MRRIDEYCGLSCWLRVELKEGEARLVPIPGCTRPIVGVRVLFPQQIDAPCGAIYNICEETLYYLMRLRRSATKLYPPLQ